MDRQDELTAVWKALEVVAHASDDVIEEALAGMGSDNPKEYRKLENQFSNSRGWCG